MNIKTIAIILGILLLAVVAFVFMGGTKKIGNNENKEIQGIVLTGENKADIYNTYTIEEWNSFRFKYKDDWSVEKEYGDDKKLKKVIIKKDSNEDNYIFIGGIDDCGDMKNERCVLGGYGLMVEPIYTSSKDEAVLKVFDSLIKSIVDFQGIYSFDSKSLKGLLDNFFKAKINGDKEALESLVSLKFFNSQIFNYIISGQVNWSRYEIADNIKFIDNNDYQVKISIFEYYGSKEKEIGSREALISIINNSNNYLIDNIELGELINN
jgi:hypothetical protein